MDCEINSKLAKLIGALDEEVAVNSTLTENIHKLIATFYKPTKERNKIIALDKEFSSDIYAL